MAASLIIFIVIVILIVVVVGILVVSLLLLYVILCYYGFFSLQSIENNERARNEVNAQPHPPAEDKVICFS